MAVINWTRESEIWLRDIYNYIAVRTTVTLRREQSPEFTRKPSYSWSIRGLVRRYEPEQVREVRILLYEHYRITYLIRPDGDIDILGVFHGALEIERYFI